jgi:hypothetical protein
MVRVKCFHMGCDGGVPLCHVLYSKRSVSRTSSGRNYRSVYLSDASRGSSEGRVASCVVGKLPSQ